MASSSPWSSNPAEKVIEQIMNPQGLDLERQKAIEDVVRADMPKIKLALKKMERAIRDMPDISQKSTIERFVSAWIVSNTNSMEDALDLAQHLSGVLQIYIMAELVKPEQS